MLPAQSREKRPATNHYFYDPALFPHLDVLTQHAELILGELRAALGSAIVSAESRNGAVLSGVWCEDKQFDDFYQSTKNQQGWLHWWSVNNPDRPNNDWTIFGLMNNGQYMTENCALCPQTTRLLEQVPGIRVAGFSRIQPRSGIDTHKGFTGRMYGALAYHLGLLIPSSGASLVCGPEVHHWRKAGEVIVFDDTYPHSAWNDSDSERIILYIDFKVPEEVVPRLPPLNLSEFVSDSDSEDEEENQKLQEWLNLVKDKHS